MQLKGDLIAAYARYSSDRQNESSVEDQLRRLRAFAAARGHQLSPHLTFTDHAISGASMVRPAFELLMEKVRRREVDVVLVEDTSRLSRDNADALNLYKIFNFFGVQLVAISDGIDSMTKGAKLAYSVKALMSDLYLEDLRDKTLRGMEGRAHSGLSTGGLPIGYRSVPIPGPDPRAPAGFRIEIDEARAETVRRIFELYIDGQSQNAIAVLLNAGGVPSPRDRMRHHRKPGWGNGTIRVVLRNEKYHGVWRFNVRRWIKMPGTNRRVPQKKDPSEVITYHRPELAIVDEATWQAAQARLRETSARYTLTLDGRRKGRALAARGVTHAFSGLLECECGGPMTIYGGDAERRYYGCLAGRRGRCKKRSLVREDVIQHACLAAVTELLTTAIHVSDIRKQFAREIRLNAARRTRLADLRETIMQIERQIAELPMTKTHRPASLQEMERRLTSARRKATLLEGGATRAAVLRSNDQVLRGLMDLEERVYSAPMSARETLRRLFGGFRIHLAWTSDHQVATAQICPAHFLLAPARVSDNASGLPLTRLDPTLTLRCLLIAEDRRLRARSKT